MLTKEIGKSGIYSSAIGLGTWAIGGDLWGGSDKQDSIGAIEKAVDLGLNLIDTAPIYGFGVAETIVGQAIKNKREKVVLSTKCGLNWQSEKGVLLAERETGKIYKYLGKEFIQEELEDSLKRLQTDYIDVYHTHWQDESTPLEETMEILLKLKQQGKIKSIAVSNVNLKILKKYTSLGRIDAVQEEYSLLNDKIESDLLPYCKENSISLLAYCPLCQGLLAGKIKPSHKFKEGDMRKEMKSFSLENLEKIASLNQNLQPIADQYELSIAQLIIAWTLTQVSHVLCGARNSKQVQENIEGAKVTLKEKDILEVKKLAKDSKAFFGMLQ